MKNLTSASTVERERGCSWNLEMKIMSYFKWSKMRSQPLTRSLCSHRILRALVCTGTWGSRGIDRTKRYHLLLMAKTRLNIPRLAWESTYVTWIGIDFVIPSTSYKPICLALIPIRIFWFFPRVGSSNLLKNSLRAVLHHGEVSEIPIQNFHSGNELTYSSPLELMFPAGCRTAVFRQRQQ